MKTDDYLKAISLQLRVISISIIYLIAAVIVTKFADGVLLLVGFFGAICVFYVHDLHKAKKDFNKDRYNKDESLLGELTKVN